MQRVRAKHEASKVVMIGVLLAVFRFLPTRIYNKVLFKLINSVSEYDFPYYARDFIGIIKFSKGISKSYKNSYFETESIIEQFRRFKPYYLHVVAEVKKNRRKMGLKE